MKLSLDNSHPWPHYLLVEHEPGDRKFYGRVHAAGESALLYAIKTQLNSRGYDFIKKRMWKDGHMVDEYQQYLRERKATNGRMLAIYSGFFAIEDANTRLNRNGKVELVVTDIGVGI